MQHLEVSVAVRPL